MASPSETGNASLSQDLASVFGFILSFSGFTREQALEITIEASARALDGASTPERFRTALFRQAFEEARRRSPAGTADLSAFPNLAPAKAPTFLAVRRATLKLGEEGRAALLLRDQCHLPLALIGSVLGADEHWVRSAVLSARESLRAEVQKLLEARDGL